MLVYERANSRGLVYFPLFQLTPELVEGKGSGKFPAARMVEPEDGHDAEASVRRELEVLMQESRALMDKLPEDSVELITEVLNSGASPLSKLVKRRLSEEGGDGARANTDGALAGIPPDESRFLGEREGEVADSPTISASSLQTSKGRSEGGTIAQSVAELIMESEALLDKLPQESVTSLSAGDAQTWDLELIVGGGGASVHLHLPFFAAQSAVEPRYGPLPQCSILDPRTP